MSQSDPNICLAQSNLRSLSLICLPGLSWKAGKPASTCLSVGGLNAFSFQEGQTGNPHTTLSLNLTES